MGEQPAVLTGGHPGKVFYGPAENAPEEDFGHVVGDGLVVIRYAPTLPAHQVDALKTYVTDAKCVTSGPAQEAEPAVRAIAQQRTLSCAEFDLTAVQDFTEHWIADFIS